MELPDGTKIIVGQSAIGNAPDLAGNAQTTIALTNVTSLVESQANQNPDGSAAYMTVVWAAGNAAEFQGQQVDTILGFLNATDVPPADPPPSS